MTFVSSFHTYLCSSGCVPENKSHLSSFLFVAARFMLPGMEVTCARKHALTELCLRATHSKLMLVYGFL